VAAPQETDVNGKGAAGRDSAFHFAPESAEAATAGDPDVPATPTEVHVAEPFTHETPVRSPYPVGVTAASNVPVVMLPVTAPATPMPWPTPTQALADTHDTPESCEIPFGTLSDFHVVPPFVVVRMSADEDPPTMTQSLDDVQFTDFSPALPAAG
jgi:hypothetical protein